jgi:hypothetical protein
MPYVKKQLSYLVAYSALSFILSGCSVFSPYVKYVAEDFSKDSSTMLLNSVNNIKASQQAIQCKLDEATNMQGSAKLLTFGAIGATGIGSLYGVTHDTLLGLAGGTAATYSFGTLFYPDAQRHNYLQAIEDLQCVINTGNFQSSCRLDG